MNNTIKIAISVEYEIQTGLRANFEITDMLFTDYNNLFDYESIQNNLSTALKMLKGFTMLTIDLYTYDSNSWRSDKDIITGKRFLNRYDEMTVSNLQGNKYEVWLPCTKKLISSALKEITETANRKFIELVKTVTV